jgi:glycosyltransferase involved in cell wall biosynthesis
MLVSTLFPPNVVGGAEQGAYTISQALAERGHDVHVVTLQGPLEVDQTGGAGNRVTVHRVPLANIYWPFNGATRNRTAAEKLIWHTVDTANELMAHRVQKIVRDVNPDIVLAGNLQGFSTAILPAIKRCGKPLVQSLHDFALLCPQTALFRNGKGCGTGSNRCMRCRVLTAPRHRHLDAVDAVIGVSRAVLDLHRQHGLFSGRPSKVIYNALKPSLEIQTEPPKRPHDHVFTFGFMGRVDRMKGIETLLAAAHEVEAQGYRFRLLVAGRAENDTLQSLKQRWPSGNIDYVGYVDSAHFLPSLDVLIFPSEWLEALGNGVFEAFSQGVPVIGSDAGGIPESIDPEINGLVFPRGNTRELADSMIRLISNPRLQRAMAEAAIAKSVEYKASNRARQVEEFFLEVLAKSKQAVAA